MRQKKLVITLLVLLAFVVSGFTYAYWASGISINQAGNETANIEIGTGAAAVTTVTVVPTVDDGVLVPVGRATGGQVESLTYTFEVTWTATDSTASGATGTLTVGASANHGLLNVVPTYNSNITAGGSTVTVTIVVTLTEPANQAEYAEVAGNNFTLTVTFNVAQN